MPKVTVQARMPGETEWNTRNTLFHADDVDMVVAQAGRLMDTWRINYLDGAELRILRLSMSTGRATGKVKFRRAWLWIHPT